jgi:hypothetical protein
MEQAGFTPEDYEHEEVEVWPENWLAFGIFSGLQTQWLVGMNGPIGLNYAALYPLLDRRISDPEEWDLVFDDIREMERAALAALK